MPNLNAIISLTLYSMMLGAIAWHRFKSRPLASGEIDAVIFESKGAPRFSDNAIVYRFNDHKARAIIFDADSQMLHLANCHVPARFFSLSAAEWFSCPASDVLGVDRHRRRGVEYFLITTKTGKAWIQGDAAGFTDLRAALIDRFPASQPEFWLILFIMAEIAAGAVIGMTAVLSLIPFELGVSEFAVSLLVGGVIGMITMIVFRRSLWQSFGASGDIVVGSIAIGMGLGLAIGSQLKSGADWRSAVIGGMIGTMTGVWLKQKLHTRWR